MGASQYDSHLDIEVAIWYISRQLSKHNKMPEGCHEKHESRHLWSGASRTTCYSTCSSGVATTTITTTAAGWNKTWLCWVISDYFYQSDQKNLCFDRSFSSVLVHIFSRELQYAGSAISLCIAEIKYQSIAMHWWIVTPLIKDPQRIVKCSFYWWIIFSLTGVKSLSYWLPDCH